MSLGLTNRQKKSNTNNSEKQQFSEVCGKENPEKIGDKLEFQKEKISKKKEIRRFWCVKGLHFSKQLSHSVTISVR